MSMARRIFLVFAALSVLAVRPAGAQAPRVINARVENRSVSAGLAGEFQAIVSSQNSSAWIGYAVPMIAGDRQICCFDSYSDYSRTNGSCGRCRLESTGDGMSISNSDKQNPVRLEGPRRLVVLYRVEQKRVEKIRSFSEECELDAGGLPFVWLGDVRASDSVALLASYVNSGAAPEDGKDRSAHQALGAIALTDDPSADRALEKFVAPEQSEEVRGKTAFWLGEARGKTGYRLLERMARQDPSDRVREKVTFALSVSHEPEAVDTMIRMAKSDSSSRVRGQALFWLAQKAGKKAESAITDAIENDPETDVKKKAVFALSQLPKEEGVPLLIQVARTNHNPAVRKQAMFWLGQSNDPRALGFFEEILAH
jgi:hypothetical protein